MYRISACLPFSSDCNRIGPSQTPSIIRSSVIMVESEVSDSSFLKIYLLSGPRVNFEKTFFPANSQFPSIIAVSTRLSESIVRLLSD